MATCPTAHESPLVRVPLSRGFTLLELMIVVGIIAIIAAVAVPSYREYVLRSHRSEGIIALTELSNLQEKFYSANNRYVITDASIRSSLFYPATTPHSYYKLDLAPPAGGGDQGYTLTAEHIGAQTADKKCKTFTFDNVGRKGATDSTNATSATIIQTCWDR